VKMARLARATRTARPARRGRAERRAGAGEGEPPVVDPRYCRYDVRVGKSPIQGWGVYAEERIPAGRKVIEYTGEKILRKEADRRLKRAFAPGGTKRVLIFILSKKWCIDAGVGGGGAELINHACDPNLVTKKTRDRIYYYSRKKIRVGEELTVDYRFPPDSIQVECKCGSRKCRGTINMRRKDWEKRLGRKSRNEKVRGAGGRRRKK